METARVAAAPQTPSPSAAPANLAGLGNRIVALFVRRLPREAFAAEVAKLVLQALRGRAVAIFAHDVRRDRLVLLADEGLDAEGRAALGGGSDCPWDIPLRSLRNRRISVIAGAHQNPFVPRALANLSPRALSIASLPIFADQEPVGAMLLFATGVRSFGDSQLQILSQALRVCGPGMREAGSATQRTGGPVAQPENVEATIAKLIAAGAIIDPAATSAALAPIEPPVSSPPHAAHTPAAQQVMDDLIARVQAFERELAKAQEEIEASGRRMRALTMTNSTLTRERDSLDQQLANIGTAHSAELSAVRVEQTALQERLLAVEAERARIHRLAEGRHTAAQQSIATLEHERDVLQNRAQASEATVAELQTLLAAVFDERDRLTTQVETLSGELRLGQETLQRTQTESVQERAALEADRDGWQEEAATVRAQLAQRTEQFAAVERDWRSASVARDAVIAQLSAARAEIERLTSLGDEMAQEATQLDAARAAATAENAALRRALEEERATRLDSEGSLRTQLIGAEADVARLTTAADAMRADLAERNRLLGDRDEQLDQLRQQHEAARQAETSHLETVAGLRTDLSAVSARLEQTAAERQQLIDERAALRSALAELRRRASQNDVAHAATVGQLQAEAVELRRQTAVLGSDRASLADRLQRTMEEGRDLARRLAEAQRRSDDLSELLRQREADTAAGVADREQLTAQVTTLNGQLRATQEAVERTQARATQERAAFDAQRTAWDERSAAVQAELAQRTENVLALERDLRSTMVARDAATGELQLAQDDRSLLSATLDSVQRTLVEVETDRDSAAASLAALRRTVDSERAAHTDAERSLRADLTAARTEAERLAGVATVLRNDIQDRTRSITERDEQLATLQRELELLRQESADRGVLAHQASELGRQVVALEQELAAVRGDSARAERQRATLSEELDALRAQYAETTAAAARARAAAHDAQQHLFEQQQRAEAEATTLRGDLQVARAAHTELQAALERAHAERTRALENEEQAARLLDDFNGALQQRDGALAAATTDRQQLFTELTALKAELRDVRGTLESTTEAADQDRGKLLGERDRWQQQATAGQAEAERLAATVEELRRHAAQLDAARTTAATEVATLRRSLEQERATSLQTTGALQTDLAAVRATAQQLSADTASLREALADRDAEVSLLRQKSDSAQDAQSEGQRTASALRADVARLAAQLDDQLAESQQLRVARDAVEHQLALVTEAHGEEEQTLAHALQAAREQIAHLELDATHLRAALHETRQQAGAADLANATTIENARAGTEDLRRQITTLKASSAQLTKRLDRTEAALATQTERADAESQRAVALAEQSNRLGQTLAARDERHALLEDQLAQARANLAATALELRKERTARADVEQQLTQTASTQQDANAVLATQLDGARTRIHELEAAETALQAALNDAHGRVDRSATAYAEELQQVENDAALLRTQLVSLTTAHTDLGQRLQRTEQALALRTTAVDDETRRSAALAEQCRQLEQSVQVAEERRTTLSSDVAQARMEVEALRQQSADRGVLARQASELGTRVVTLEQQLAAVRGEAAQAERQRAVLAEEVEAARRMQAQTEVVADRKLATLRDAVDRLTEERRRLEAHLVERNAEADAQRATAAELHAAFEQLRIERAGVDEQNQDLAHRLGEAHRRLEENSAQLRQRETAIDAAGTDRSRLAAQVTKLTGQLRDTKDTLEALEGRAALERSALEAERDRLKEQASAARAELETLLDSADAVTQGATEAAAARAAAEAEVDAVRRTLEQERLGRQQAEEGLRADMAALRSDLAGLTSDAATLRSQLIERDAQIGTLLEAQEDARQAQAAWQQASASARAEVAALNVRLDTAVAEVQQFREERDQREQQLHEQASAHGEAAQTLSSELQAARTQLRAVERERTTVQTALAEHQQRTRGLAATHAAAIGEIQAAADELRGQVTHLTATRDQLTERLERAEQHLADRSSQAQDETLHVTTLAERCAQLEQRLGSADTRRAALDSELIQVRMEVDTLRVQSAEHGAIAEHTSDLSHRIADLEQKLATTRGETTRAERQRNALAEELDAAHQLRAQLVSAAEAEQARLRERLQQLADERKRIEALQAQQLSELEAHRSSVTELRVALEQTRDERLQFEQEGQDLAHQLGDAHRRLDELSTQLRQREAAIDAAATDRKRLEDAVRAAEAAAQMLTTERAAPLHADARTIRGIETQASASAAEPDTVLVIERSAPLSEVLDPGAETADVIAEPLEPLASAEPVRELVLLDAGKRSEEASAALRGAGFEVTIVAPTEQSVDDLARRTISCVLINLAAGPAAWRTLKVLRDHAATRDVPILAYLMPPDGQKGFCFGRADFGLWPIEPERLMHQLTALRPKAKRLLAVSADVDGMGKLRDPLAKANISTSIVLDGKQALEFTTIVSPEAAVLHLSPQTNAIARFVGGIRAQDTTANLPLLLLLDKTQPREEGFFAATVRELLVKGTFQFAALPSQIARVIA